MLDFKKIEAAINQIQAEKKIPREVLISIIESAIKTAYKKDYGSRDEKVNVSLDLDSCSLEITLEKTLVKEVKNPATEISFEELWEDAEWFKEWDVIEIDVTDNINNSSFWETFWRIASQAARQVIIQKIWDTERQKVYNLLKDKKWELISAKVISFESGKVIFDYNWNHVTLSKSERVSRDNYVPGARFYLYVSQVIDDEKTWPKVVLSRRDKNIVRAIFSLYVPELNEWIIQIENIVRHPWIKTKILVYSNNDEVDPAWTMIWSKWIRVKSVMEELSGEKIDIITNNWNIAEIIAKSLTPADVNKVEVDNKNMKAKVYLKKEERAKAIWKNGININLASDLTWYDISLIEEED